MSTPTTTPDGADTAPMALASASQTSARSRPPRDPRMSLAAFLADVRAEDEAHGGIRHDPDCRGCTND